MFRMTLIEIILLCFVASTSTAVSRASTTVEVRGATDSEEQATFEVASIKPSDSRKDHTVGVTLLSNGRVTMNGVTLKELIAIAYGLGYWQIAGGPPWMDKTQFDLEALPPEEKLNPYDLRHSLYTIRDPRLRRMMERLLVDRFGLSVRNSAVEGTVYVLEKTSRPLRLVRSKYAVDISADHASGEIDFVGKGRWRVFDTSMEQFCTFASSYVLHAPVIDNTGLQGTYDYDSGETYAGVDDKSEDFSIAFMAMLREIGLGLRKAKGTVVTLSVDSASYPTPN